MWLGSQYPDPQADSLGFMLAKYYTRFLLRSTEEEYADEYSGVVELNHDNGRLLDPSEIEALLADNFQREIDDVELLNWSRLH